MLEQLQQLVESEMSGQHVHESKSEKVMTIPLPTGQESSPSSQFKEPSTNSLVYADREELVLEGAYEHGMGRFYDAVVTRDIKREEEINTIFEADFPEGPSIRNIVFQTQKFTSEEPAGALDETENLHDSAQVPTSALPPAPPQKPPTGGGEIAAMEPEGDDEQKASKPEAKKPEGSAPTEAATDTELQTLLTDLEPYRAHETSSFYFIPDREAADQFVERLQTGNIPYGIEFGPGEIPSKLSEIDPKVPLWVAFEPDGTAVVYAMETVDYLENAGRMVESNKVVYVQKGMDQSNIQSDIPGLQTVVYRNSDYREFIPFPDKDFVENGKRVVMINDGTHLPEAGHYQNFLQEKGIPKEEFVHTEQDLSHIPWDHTPESYVYDSKGELTSAQTTENVTEANIQSKTEGNKESNDTDNPPASPPPELPPTPPQKPPTSGGEIAAMEPEGDDEQNASKPEVTKPETSAPTEASTDTELQTLLTDLEPYRANETSSFYFISDPTKAQEVIQKLEAGNVPYGIEFGPGTSVSKLSEIDPGVSVWLAFEPDSQPFERAERTTELYEKMGKLNEPNQIVYLKESLRQQNIRSDIEGLKVVVYRNPDYRYDVPFPDQEFRENRRVVLINDSVHIGEENQYRDFLGWHGISSDQLVFIERNLNNSNWDITEESYVYDSTGALIQSKKEAIEQLLKEARENSTDSSSTETESEQEPADGDNATDRNDI